MRTRQGPLRLPQALQGSSCSALGLLKGTGKHLTGSAGLAVEGGFQRQFRYCLME